MRLASGIFCVDGIKKADLFRSRLFVVDAEELESPTFRTSSGSSTS